MKTDSELLELAAKAVGRGDKWWVGDGKLKWDPLTDDGDALRLAVKCGIVMEYRREVPMAFAYCYARNLEVGERNTTLDPYAATRRAIVKAAAQIGEQL